MNNIKQDATIGEVVVLVPEATEIFSEFGIDFCCGGHRLLSQVMKDQGINPEVVYERLQDAIEKRKSSYDDKNYSKMSPAVLSAYIEDTHHGYLRKVLPETVELLNTVLRVHGKNHRELFEIYRLFGQLKTDLEQHLLKEETILFPILDKVDDNRSEVISVTDEIINEHEAAGEILRELREISNNYTLPEGACKTYEKTYSLLEDIEKDLHQHIHLENNILLKEYANR
jgi:regulator of cell morphogenesis and NO signaling